MRSLILKVCSASLAQVAVTTSHPSSSRIVLAYSTSSHSSSTTRAQRAMTNSRGARLFPFFTHLKDSITHGGACSTLPPFGALTGSQARRPSCATTDERWLALGNGFRIDVSNIEQLPLRLRGLAFTSLTEREWPPPADDTPMRHLRVIVLGRGFRRDRAVQQPWHPSVCGSGQSCGSP
jgi:hypothetical protein